MSMLAEPRRKQKLSNDPRGSVWSKDDSKFGQKMLEKFGWSKGKGLGAKEDGKVDHVKVSLKNNNHGLGCSKSNVDNWIAHQDDFNTLLANLNQSNSQDSLLNNMETDKVISLENKSKTSRSRVHYQKFTKGKDLSLKSAKDLDCIFGRRNTKTEDSAPSESPDEEEDVKDQKIDSGFITVKSQDNIQDYFAKKMLNFKQSRSSSQPELHSILKDKTKENTCFNDNDTLDRSLSKRVSFIIGDSSEQENSEDSRGDNFECRKSKKKKSKKRKNENLSEECSIEVVNDLNSMESENNSVESVQPAKKKKKTGSQSNEDLKYENTTTNINGEVDKTEKKKKKKKSKSQSDEDENLVNGNSLSMTDSIMNENIEKKKKKKKSRVKKEKDDIDTQSKVENDDINTHFMKNDDSQDKPVEKTDDQDLNFKEQCSSVSTLDENEKQSNREKLMSALEELGEDLTHDKNKRKIKKKKTKDMSSSEKTETDKMKNSDKQDKNIMTVSNVVDELASAFKGSNVSQIKGYATHTGYGIDIQRKLKKKSKNKVKKQKKIGKHKKR